MWVLLLTLSRVVFHLGFVRFVICFVGVEPGVENELGFGA